MVEHFFTYIDIENFKSIKKLRIDGCKRINLFIGPPNVGKSNILEALSLFSLPYFRFQTPKRLDNFIRVNYLAELFSEGNNYETIKVNTNQIILETKYDKNGGFLDLKIKENVDSGKLLDHVKSDNKLWLRNGSVLSNSKYKPFVKRYLFNLKTKYSESYLDFLIPPFGNNLSNCIELNNDLNNEIKTLLKDYNLEAVYDRASSSIKFQKKIKNDEILQLAYNLIADTLQRYLFHLTAIKSNENSILLFEEPEANCFPPYIRDFTQDIIDSKTNQFFIATHSDIVVNHFLENAFDETTIYMVDFKNGQTVVQSLTEQQKLDIVNDGIDIFFNRDYFLTSNN